MLRLRSARRTLELSAALQVKLFFDVFDKSGSQFFCRVPRQEAGLAVQLNFRVVRTLFESRPVLLQPPDKLTLFHVSPILVSELNVIIIDYDGKLF